MSGNRFIMIRSRLPLRQTELNAVNKGLVARFNDVFGYAHRRPHILHIPGFNLNPHLITIVDDAYLDVYESQQGSGQSRGLNG